MTYDEALQILVDIVLERVPGSGASPGRDKPIDGIGASPGRIVIVRDVVGRLRMCMDGPVVADLEAALTGALGAWFAPPILFLQGKAQDQHLAAEGILEIAKTAHWPKNWPTGARATNRNEHPENVDTAVWAGLLPAVAKGSWFRAAAPKKRPPRRVPVVGFHSFKGGVGRTTSAALLAYLAACAGKLVVLLDLDLEAPGLHHVLGLPTAEAGVLDYVLEHQATGSLLDVRCLSVELGVVPPGFGSITCIHAGAHSATYLERLGHIDFASPLEDRTSSAAIALEALLKKVSSSRIADPPDCIFLDARAGLHDLGAIALRDLANIHVLVARASDQGLQGLRQTLDLLSTGNHATQGSVLLLQTFVPQDPFARTAVVGAFVERTYELFSDGAWFDPEDPPAIDNDDSPHAPATVPLLAEGNPGERLADLVTNLSIVDAYRPAWDRLRAILEREAAQ